MEKHTLETVRAWVEEFGSVDYGGMNFNSNKLTVDIFGIPSDAGFKYCVQIENFEKGTLRVDADSRIYTFDGEKYTSIKMVLAVVVGLLMEYEIKEGF